MGSEPVRLSPTHCYPEDNSSLTSCTQTDQTFPRTSCVKDWPRPTRPTRMPFLFSVSSTNPLLTPRNLSQLTDWSDTDWPRRLTRLPDNKESKRRTERRRSLVLPSVPLRELLEETLINLLRVICFIDVTMHQ